MASIARAVPRPLSRPTCPPSGILLSGVSAPSRSFSALSLRGGLSCPATEGRGLLFVTKMQRTVIWCLASALTQAFFLYALQAAQGYEGAGTVALRVSFRAITFCSTGKLPA